MSSPTGTYRELTRRWEALRDDGVRVREIACDGVDRAMLCVDAGDPARPQVAIAAGVHGDEPAGPWALLDLVENGALPPRFAYRIWPCTNPTGFDAATRANADGIDVNRTFGGTGTSPEARTILATNAGCDFVLSIDLHEDCDAAGFYCYEYGGGRIGRRVLGVLETACYPIDPLELTFELAGPLDDVHCTRERGRVYVPDAGREAALLDGLSYSIAMARQIAAPVLTFETPSAAPRQTRQAMHRTAVLAAIDALLEESASTS